MKNLLKVGIYLGFLMLCVLAYEEDRKMYFTTVSVEQDMDCLEYHIEIQEGVSASAIDTVKKEIKKLPTKLWKQYFYDGGKLKIVHEEISNSEKNVVGSFSIINDVDMTIIVNEEYIEYSLCHEFSHYLNYLIDEDVYLGYRYMLSEKEDIWQELMISNNYFYSENEYFAEVGKLYFSGRIDPDIYPKTVEFFDVITEQYR